MRKTIIAAGVTGTLFSGLLGMGVGYLAADGMPDVETKTRTITEEVVREVKVPGPTREVEVVKTKEVVPEDCRSAISSAENVGLLAGDLAGITAKWPMLVPRAFDAGLNQSPGQAQKVISDMEDLTEDMKNLQVKVEDEVSTFNKAKAGC